MNTQFADACVERTRALLYAVHIYLAVIICLGSLWGASPAGASEPLTTCKEDGGQADCTSPQPGAYTYYLAQLSGNQIWGYAGPFDNEEDIYAAIPQSGYCTSTASPTPPYSWNLTQTPVNNGGQAQWRSPTITQNLTTGDCKTGQVVAVTEYWVGLRAQPWTCPVGTRFGNANAHYPFGYCWFPAVQPPQKGQCVQCLGKPIDPAYGNEIHEEVDYPGNGFSLLRFARTYNYAGTSFGPGQPNGATGQGWSHSFERRLWLFSGDTVRVLRPDGTHRVFTPVSGGGYQESGTAVEQLIVTPTGWNYIDSEDTIEAYDSDGLLRSITYRGGATLTLTYSTGPSNVAPHAGLLVTVSDAFGHQLNFSYNGDQIGTMTDPSGATYNYTYSGSVLTAVQYPDGTTRQFVYNESANTHNTNLPYALTGIIDESGTRYATIGYNGQGQAVSTELAGGVNKYTLTINYTQGNPAFNYVTDPLGYTHGLLYSPVNGVVKYQRSSTVCLTCTDAPASVSYDANGNISNRTDYNGNQTNFTFDLTRNLETSRVEAAGTSQSRTILTTWDPSWRQPDLITEPNRQTSFTYDGLGNVLTSTMSDTTVTPNVARTWTYTYDNYGRVLTAKGPRTDLNSTTSYTYYTCTAGYQCGQVHTVTDAAGNVTTYNTYNASAQPLTITDPNGILTTLTYDARQRLTSRQAANETTAFDYWPTGLLKKVTLPDASTLTYTYDGAHRLTQITDSLGNKVVYSLDAIGNRTAENSYDPSGTLHRTHTRVFNTLNQLYQEVNAAGTAAVTTTFGYDANSNQTSVSAPLSRNTANTYDALNRLKQITDPANGITQFGYDANDNLTSVTDPRHLVTSYVYSGFGDLRTQTSPDTATTANTYDLAGNLAISTDARGAVSTYAYDNLNRLTSVAYSQGGSTDQTLTFTYDAGTNGKGHLTAASDANHSLSWSYDALGRVTGKSQTVGSITKSVGYAYTNGNLTTLTTPSGQTVTYGYNGNHQVTSVAVNGTTVLNSITYEPLGPVDGWTWGNSTTTTRTYDTDGKISQIVSAGTKSYSYDNAFRITGLTDTSPGAANWTYGYDNLDRLTSGTSPSITRGWTYDANGNRLTETGTAPSTYTISPSSNRITGITGALARTYAYDPAGNATGYSTVAASYNNAGRLQTLANGSSTETSLYNALGQRIEISGGVNGTVLYAYDEAGHLLGEYDGTGGLIEETIWLGDTPVATLRPNGSTVSIYYIHSDQLNTPRQITRPSDNVAMWTWNSEPFGTDAANPNPSGAGAFAYNLRFAGQLFDGQAGLHQNWHRDFDPASARYLESDPLGVAVSTNTYSYVDADPIDYVDPFGLAKCTYSISEHRMTCVSNDGSKETVVGPEGLWSGMGMCTNNSSKACINSQERGPIPPGQYRMNRDTRAEHAGRNFWRLEPMPKVPGWKCGLPFGMGARCGFEFHPGSMSLGCITADKTDPELMKQYIENNALLLSEDGSNFLKVVP